VYRPLLVLASYLLGTFPTARLVVSDVTRRGSGNPGASNAYRLAGRRAGAIVLLGDALKGAVAAGAGLLAGGGGRPLAVACGAAAVVGHCYPPPRRRKGGKGGKGVATAAGMTAVLYPALALAAAAIWLIVARTTAKASVASLATAAVIPLGALVTGRPQWELAVLAALAALIALRHTRNLRNLVRGEERSLR
jgi:glycerol-3-phosphate acyltransferase PlsY